MEGESKLLKRQRADESGTTLLLSNLHRLLVFGGESGFDRICGGLEIGLKALLDGRFDILLPFIVENELGLTRQEELSQLCVSIESANRCGHSSTGFPIDPPNRAGSA